MRCSFIYRHALLFHTGRHPFPIRQQRDKNGMFAGYTRRAYWNHPGVDNLSALYCVSIMIEMGWDRMDDQVSDAHLSHPHLEWIFIREFAAGGELSSRFERLLLPEPFCRD